MSLDPPETDRPHPPHCTCDGEAIELVVTTPRVGPFPELHTYRCAECGHVVTIEAE